MKNSKKQIIVSIFAMIILLSITLLSSCKDKNSNADTNSPGGATGTENGGGSQSDSTPDADITVNSFTVGYISEELYRSGDFSDESITDSISFSDEANAYMVIDFSYTLNRDVGNKKYITLDTMFPGRTFLDITVEDAPTAGTKETEYSDATVLSADFSLPAHVGDKKDIRVILRLMHLSGGTVKFELTLKTDDGFTIDGVTFKSKKLDTGTPRLIYMLNGDRKSYTVVGAHSELTDAVIPEALNNGFPVTAIRDNAFKDNSTLETVTIGNNVTEIGENAFMNCTALKEVTIGDNVISIDDYSFNGCTALSSVYVSDISVWLGIDFNGAYANPAYFAHNLFVDGELLTNLSIPEGVRKINDYAFSGCAKIERITIPADLTSIGTHAFEDCESLLGVYISSIESWCGISFGSYRSSPLNYADNLYLNGELVTELNIAQGTEEIKSFSFRGYTKLRSVSVSGDIKTIGYGVFTGCTALTDVTLSGTVEHIGQNAFSKCTALERLTLSEGTKEIGYSAFEGCTSLTAVVLPDSIVKLEPCSFSDCTKLEEITLGTSLASIGHDAFKNCTKLKNVYYSGDEALWANIKINDGNDPIINADVHYTYKEQ